jgi:hypothetical protein
MLYVPRGGNSFAAVQSNQAGRPSVTQGNTMTPGVGSKGSWVQLIASLTDDTFGLIICLNANQLSGNSRNTVVDIGIGPAASEVVLIADLIGGNAVAYNVTGGGIWYYFPVAIPAGTRIAARAQSTVTATIACFIQAMQKPQNPSMFKACSHVETIGMTAPQGTGPYSPGTGSEGAWQLLGASTRDNWFWQIAAQVNSADTSHLANAIHLDLAYGDATNKDILLESILMHTSTAEGAVNTVSVIGAGGFVPAGTNIYARAQNSGNTEPIFIAAYGAGG